MFAFASAERETNGVNEFQQFVIALIREPDGKEISTKKHSRDADKCPV